MRELHEVDHPSRPRDASTSRSATASWTLEIHRESTAVIIPGFGDADRPGRRCLGQLDATIPVGRGGAAPPRRLRPRHRPQRRVLAEAADYRHAPAPLAGLRSGALAYAPSATTQSGRPRSPSLAWAHRSNSTATGPTWCGMPAGASGRGLAKSFSRTYSRPERHSSTGLLVRPRYRGIPIQGRPGRLQRRVGRPPL